jgi:hypothetical protein
LTLIATADRFRTVSVASGGHRVSEAVDLNGHCGSSLDPSEIERTRHSQAPKSQRRPTRAWLCSCVFGSTPASFVTLTRPHDDSLPGRVLAALMLRRQVNKNQESLKDDTAYCAGTSYGRRGVDWIAARGGASQKSAQRQCGPGRARSTAPADMRYFDQKADDHVGGADDFPILSDSRSGIAVERCCVERFDVSNFRDAPRSAARTNVASPPNIGVAGRDARFPLTGELLIFARLGLHPPIFAVVPYEEAQASALTVSWP